MSTKYIIKHQVEVVALIEWCVNGQIVDSLAGSITTDKLKHLIVLKDTVNVIMLIVT